MALYRPMEAMPSQLPIHPREHRLRYPLPLQKWAHWQAQKDRRHQPTPLPPLQPDSQQAALIPFLLQGSRLSTLGLCLPGEPSFHSRGAEENCVTKCCPVILGNPCAPAAILVKNNCSERCVFVYLSNKTGGSCKNTNILSIIFKEEKPNDSFRTILCNKALKCKLVS